MATSSFFKKKKKKKTPAYQNSYSSDALMLRGLLGLLFIAFGILCLVSILVQLEGVVFAVVKSMVYGLGGSLAFFLPLFFIWGGGLLALSARRKMPVREFLLSFGLYICILAFIIFITTTYDKNDRRNYTLIDYIYRVNVGESQPNPSGFLPYITRSYQLSVETHQGGGLIGMLLAWLCNMLLGRVGSLIVLPLMMITLLIFLTQLDIKAIIDTIRYGSSQDDDLSDEEAALQAAHEQQWREQEAQRYMAMQQQQQQYQYQQQPPYEQPYIPPSIPQESIEKKDRFSLASITSLFKKNPFSSLRHESNMQMPPSVSNRSMPPLYTPPQSGQPGVDLYDEIIASDSFDPSEGTFAPPPVFQKKQEAKPKRQPQAPLPSFFEEESSTTIQQPQNGSSYTANYAPPKAPTASVMDATQPMPPIGSEPLSAEPGLSYFPAPASSVKMPKMSGEDIGAPKVALPENTPDKKKQEVVKQQVAYAYPSFDMLHMPNQNQLDTSREDQARAATLADTLQSFGIAAQVQNITRGPAITRFELELAAGVNVKRITSISDNIALSMASNGVRIEAPIPGKSLVGIEVPNKEIQAVTLREVLQSKEMSQAQSPLSVALGKDIAGKPIICDLSRMPHVLIAGATGSGKSVCINSIINSIIYRATPEEVRMILIDPKVVELQGYNGIPHLIVPVVSDPHKAAGALSWAVAEMMERYHKFTEKGVRNMAGYNAALTPDEEKLPFILVVIDELADLMMAAKKDVEESICRLAQLARAAGIHLIVATQRPSVDVITGLIKANIPSRIAFAVSSNIDSRTILDAVGAEKLLGRGDMLYSPSGARTPTRVQGCFVSDEEVNRITQFVRSHSQAEYDPTVLEQLEQEGGTGIGGVLPMDTSTDASDLDPLLRQAIEMAVDDGQTSISMLQRRLRIGYARSGRLIDEMTRRGIISQAAGAKPREVLITREELDSLDLD